MAEDEGKKGENKLNCWHCSFNLTWGADHDISEEDDEYCMETNLSCANCGSFYLVFLPKEEQDDGIK